MKVASVDCAFPFRLLGTVTLGAVLILAAGLASAVVPLTAVALAIGGAALVPAVALVARGLAIRSEFHTVPSLRNACQCAGMIGIGLLVVGLTAAATPLAGPAHRQTLMTGGLAMAAVLFTCGLLQVPGIAAGAAARLRYGLEGLVIGISLALVGWYVAPQLGAAYPLGYVAAVIAAVSASTTVATTLRTMRQRPATRWAGAGITLVVLGLALLVVALRPGTPPWALLAAAVPVLAGGPLMLAGARRVDLRPVATERVSLDETFGGYPMIALPVATVVLATAYHLVVVGLPDETAVRLGMVLGGVLAAREVLAARDLRRYARRSVTHEARLRALVAGASDVTVLLGDDLVVRWQSPAAAHRLGLHDEEVVGRPLTDRIHPDDVASVVDRLRLVMAAGHEPVRATIAPGPGGDATAAEAGAAGGGAGGGGGPVLVEGRLLDGHGRWRETESTVSDLRATPEIGALVMQIRDVGQRRYLERTLRRLSSIDQRTGLANRRELLRAITVRRGAGNHAGALLVIDLYGMTAVNDLRGGKVGDVVLVEVVRRLHTQVGPDDLVSRLGDSQFAVVTADRPIEAYALGVRLLAALTEPYQLVDRPVRLQASVGLAALAAGHGADDVVHRGTLALRQASQLGRNRIEWFDASLEEQLVRRLDLERHLPGAAGRGELDLVFQPVVELDGERPVGVEALLRWRHPVLGTVLPGELMPVADRLRVSEEIGEWVLHAACQQAAAWRREGHDLWLAVNVSVRQLTGDFVPEVAAALSVHQIPPERLTVEISDMEIGARTRAAIAPSSAPPPAGPAAPQSAAGGPAADEPGAAEPAAAADLPIGGDLADSLRSSDGPIRGRPAPVPTDHVDDLPAIAAQLSKLRALGVRTALGDFGAGSTDLARLRRLPLDVVKLAPLPTAGPAGELAAAVVDVARRLGLLVVAERLETAEQLAVVRRAGCRFGQGFLVARPAPAERVEAYLAGRQAASR